MSGPLTSSVLLLLSLALLQPPMLQAKSLSAARGGSRSLDSAGGAVRLRRELHDSLPYEAQMMSYPSAAERQGNDLYYQPQGWRGQGLGQALQQLMESDQRRDQEAAYLAGLLRMLSEAEPTGQGRGRDEEEEEEEDEETGDFQGPYPSDYDETEQGQAVSMAKPHAPWQGLLDPQLTRALLNRYRQERLLQTNRVPEREPDQDQEVLRYLVEKILSSLASGNPGNAANPSGRRSRRDLGAVSGAGRGGGAGTLRRSRHSLDSAPLPSPNAEVSLLRVKRLGDEEEEESGQPRRAPRAGLQRMKRIDTELQPPPNHGSRRRRALTYDPKLLAQHILQYLPE